MGKSVTSATGRAILAPGRYDGMSFTQIELVLDIP